MRWAIGLGLLATSSLACSQECEDRRDCPTGFECEAEVCVRVRPRGPSVAIDAGGRAFPDATVRDGATSPPDGGGADRDGGVGPDASMDAGAGVDGGVTEATGSRGLIWVAELRRGEFGVEFRALGELLDESGVTFDARTRVFNDAEGGQCALEVRIPQSGAPLGYAARSILVSPGPLPNASFSMTPLGNGRFGGRPAAVMGIYSRSTNAVFTVLGDGSPNSVADLTVAVPAPPIVFEVSPPEGAMVQVGALSQVLWVPSGQPLAEVSIELSDRDREVVMLCTTPDDGLYTIPAAAVAAFVAETPTPPTVFEIRHDRETTATAVAGGQTFDVVFRASWGARFPTF